MSNICTMLNVVMGLYRLGVASDLILLGFTNDWGDAHGL
ncbi:hypothetical protein ADIMK_2565 [Marinobacterium lacunae]|uniref:Uncharacterized protein n=1 Tax=Marinobacterium lacunae TaxID=1232683 RepID=A0A081FWY6_9GAMM|nr:hypothetical protein ADIMK_2565 [Marinobacterium lacunae]